MRRNSVTALVMPVYDPYAQSVGRHSGALTCLIRGQRDPNAVHMVTAREIVDTEGRIPVLFRPLDRPHDDHTVTHVAICGVVAYREDVQRDRVLRDALHRIRVEREALPPEHEWFSLGPDEESKNQYVVTAGSPLTQPIPLETLRLASGRGNLSPNLQQAFALIELPETLLPWYFGLCTQWATYAEQFAPLRARVPLLPGSSGRRSSSVKTVGRLSSRPVTYTDEFGRRRIVWLPASG
jgi:hypothetical protein